MDNNNNIFGSMCTVLPKDDCRLAMNGLIAINVNTGGTPQYKTFDIATGRLTNCNDFAMEIDGSFFLVPTMRLKPGDIILSAGSPCCVIEVGSNSIRAFSYRRGVIEEIVPEHQLFMGNAYYYRKIYSPFVSMLGGNNGMKNLVKLMVLSRMFGGSNKADMLSGMNPMLLMLMNRSGENGIFGDMFDGAFDFEEEITNVKEDA